MLRAVTIVSTELLGVWLATPASAGIESNSAQTDAGMNLYDTSVPVVKTSFDAANNLGGKSGAVPEPSSLVLPGRLTGIGGGAGALRRR